ncbi:MAG: L,D-transpeptidase, partial [Methyloligellaceae bacterium]
MKFLTPRRMTTMPVILRSLLVFGVFLIGTTASSFMAVPQAQAASVRALVDISEQRMRVYVDGKQKYSWRVSTGTRKTPTPLGSFTPFALTRKQYAKQWNMHLPYVVSLDSKGTAIHGTYQTGKLGRRASHGCIRLHPRNAAVF